LECSVGYFYENVRKSREQNSQVQSQTHELTLGQALKSLSFLENFTAQLNVPFNIHGSVHQDIISENDQQDATV